MSNREWTRRAILALCLLAPVTMAIEVRAQEVALHIDVPTKLQKGNVVIDVRPGHPVNRPSVIAGSARPHTSNGNWIGSSWPESCKGSGIAHRSSKGAAKA